MTEAKKSTTKRSPKATKLADRAVPQSEDGQLSEEELAALARMEPSDDGPIGLNGEVRPVQVGKRGRPGTEQVHIFTLDEVDYFIPKEPNSALLMAYMLDVRKGGNGKKARAAATRIATENLLLALLGEDTLRALGSSPDTTDEDIADVFAIAAHVAFGAMGKLEKKALDPS